MQIDPARLGRSVFVALLLGLAMPGASVAASLSGAYLAAMQADLNDDYAVGAEYYARALEADPGNPGLLQNAVVMHVAAGNVAAAVEYADALALDDPDNQIVALVHLSDALAKEDFTEAEAVIERGAEGFNPLLGGLVSGWITVGRQDFPAARERFDAINGNPALTAYGQYHKALALAMAGDFVSAETILAGDDDGPLHLNRGALLAHAEVLAQIDRESDAVAILDDALAGGVPDAELVDLRDRLAAGEEVPFTHVTRARDGAAEAFLTLADALDAPESGRIALIHARLAQHIRPDMVEAHMLTAELLESQEQYALAQAALANVPASSPWSISAEIRRANALRASGDPAAGITALRNLAEAHPENIEAQSALGDALRTDEQYDEAAEAYGNAIALINSPQQAHWVIFYTSGISNERAGNWDTAEAAFRTALELQPGQPLVLNYLGYSMVEQQRNLDEALEMIETAVAAQPDDGYITDSLGWVLYRLGRYEEAVPHMLRAVELTPDDPVINDHLGDVLWKVGRKREAEFQWRRALSFGPAEDLDMERVRRKLEIGLDQVLEEEQTTSDG